MSAVETELHDVEIPAAVVAGILGLTDRRLRQLVERGMPKSGRGRFPLAGCIRWYINFWRERATNRDDSRDRKLAAHTLLLEGKVERELADLLDRAEAVAAWTATVSRLANAFDTLPHKLAREHNWPGEVEHAIGRALGDFLSAFRRDSKAFLEASAD